MSDLLLLTVGTGTAGPHSNLVQGLRHTIEMLSPRKFWLIPSASEDSQLVAECVAENFLNFSEWDSITHFLSVPRPDDLESCRQTVRKAIQKIRDELQSGETLVLNPTSGTKQMSAGATIAALDENIGQIIFTIGERDHGVVKTGTERLAPFNAGGYFRERDFETASELFNAGAYFAAARILKRHHYPQAHAVAMICHYWQMFNYNEAANAAAAHCEDWRRELDRRRSIGSTAFSPLILGDILAWAIRARKMGDADTVLRLAYKALEYAARGALHEKHIMPDAQGRYKLEKITELGIDEDLTKQLAQKARQSMLILGLNDVCRICESVGHPFGHAYAADADLKKLLEVRNEIVHSIRPSPMDKAQSLLDRVQNLLRTTQNHHPSQLPEELVACNARLEPYQVKKLP
jgi:hypothetical protein